MPVRSKRWVVYTVLGVLISTLAIWNYPTAKTTARWLLWSRDYKSKVLSQPSSSRGDLKHIEWDGWGWAGMNTAVYLVFDPTDSLSPAAKNQRTINLADLVAYRARFSECVVWRVSGIPLNCTQARIGATASENARTALVNARIGKGKYKRELLRFGGWFQWVDATLSQILFAGVSKG
jgi:hypothetical protein